MKINVGLLINMLLVNSLLINFSCKKEDVAVNATEPKPEFTLETKNAINILPKSAELGGRVILNTAQVIKHKGVCWSLSPNPDTTLNEKVLAFIDSFVVMVNGLKPESKYYYRAYVITDKGVFYGNEMEFSTPSSGLTVTDIDGNEYQVVQIGKQTWMKENLKTTRYQNGDPIPTGLTNQEWQNTRSGAYSIFLDNQEMDRDFGKLYNWYAVSDPRNVCPVGWHVPDKDELITLNEFLGGYENSGGKLKSVSAFWRMDNVGATNESGFSGYPVGKRSVGGSYGMIGDVGKWGSSSERPDVSTWGYSFGMPSWDDYLAISPDSKQEGVAVRCLKD